MVAIKNNQSKKEKTTKKKNLSEWFCIFDYIWNFSIFVYLPYPQQHPPQLVPRFCFLSVSQNTRIATGCGWAGYGHGNHVGHPKLLSHTPNQAK